MKFIEEYGAYAEKTAEAMRYAIKNSKKMIQLKYRIENGNLVV